MRSTECGEKLSLRKFCLPSRQGAYSGVAIHRWQVERYAMVDLPVNFAPVVFLPSFLSSRNWRLTFRSDSMDVKRALCATMVASLSCVVGGSGPSPYHLVEVEFFLFVGEIIAPNQAKTTTRDGVTLRPSCSFLVPSCKLPTTHPGRLIRTFRNAQVSCSFTGNSRNKQTNKINGISGQPV